MRGILWQSVVCRLSRREGEEENEDERSALVLSSSASSPERWRRRRRRWKSDRRELRRSPLPETVLFRNKETERYSEQSLLDGSDLNRLPTVSFECHLSKLPPHFRLPEELSQQLFLRGIARNWKIRFLGDDTGAPAAAFERANLRKRSVSRSVACK